MRFCQKCDNKLYIKLQAEDSDILLNYCNNCGHEEPIDPNNSDSLCVSKTIFKKSAIKFENAVNKYTKLDPTLPRTATIKCPCNTCISNTDDSVSREVIFVRYDDSSVKYVYLCTYCDTVWKTDEQN